MDTDSTLVAWLDASLSVGIRVSMFVYNFLCALYNTHAPMESPYALGLCDIFYVHCSLVLFASEAHGICEFCLANSASQDSRVSLVQDSIWIYLFFMVIWTYFTLYVGEISILRGTLYYGSNTRWRTSSFYGSLGFILLLCFCSIATYYFGTGCQFSSNFGLWFGEILAVTFG